MPIYSDLCAVSSFVVLVTVAVLDLGVFIACSESDNLAVHIAIHPLPLLTRSLGSLTVPVLKHVYLKLYMRSALGSSAIGSARNPAASLTLLMTALRPATMTSETVS